MEVVGLIELLDPARAGRTIHGLPVRLADDLPAPDERLAILALAGQRSERWRRLSRHGWRAAPPVVHPQAILSPSARVAEGAIVGPAAVLAAEAALGPHAVVGRGSLVGHHTRIGATAVLGPGVNVAGNTSIGDDAAIGMGGVVLDRLVVGAGAVVAAGAVVVVDVSAGRRVQGVPAREYRP